MKNQLTAHLEARAAFEPQFTPSPRTIIAEFLRATIAKESAIGFPAFSAVCGCLSYNVTDCPVAALLGRFQFRIPNII